MDFKTGYICYIENPASGLRAKKPIGQAFADYLTSHGYSLRRVTTKSLDHAQEIARQASSDSDCKLVVAIGGDGTIREVAQGLSNSDTILLMLPGGTENLLASEFGIDDKLSTAIRIFKEGVVKHLDLGVIGDSCFTSIASFGFDAHIVKLVNFGRSGNISYFSYVKPFWQTFWHYRPPLLEVAIDGKTVFSDYGMVFVGNISRYATGLRILSKADCSDGRIDVCACRYKSRWRLLLHFIAIFFGLHLKSKSVFYAKADRVTISSPKSVPTEIDGDPGPDLPLEISVLPKAVECLLLENSKPIGALKNLFKKIKIK